MNKLKHIFVLLLGLSIIRTAGAQVPSTSINGTPPPYVFNGSGVSQVGQTFTFSGGGGSGTVGAGTAGQYARYLANGTAVSGVNGTSVLVTDPPFNAKCDGTGGGTGTDDTAAINAALASGASVVNLPFAAYTCKVTATITVPEFVDFRGNWGTIDSTVSSGNAMEIAYAQVDNIYLAMEASSGTVTAFHAANGAFLSQVADYLNNSTPFAGYTSLEIDNNGITLVNSGFYGPVNFFQNGANQTIYSQNNTYDGAVTIKGGNYAISFNNDLFYYVSSFFTPTCWVCIATDSHTAQIGFNNSQFRSSSAIIAIDNTSGVSAKLAGWVDTSLLAGGSTNTSGAWTGVLNENGTTIRGSAATLTYRCNGGTQAGLIYTNNSSCTGGTAVATGDSVQ